MPIEFRREFYKKSFVKKFEFSYVNDVREGVSKWWYENGNPLLYEEYRNDLLHGTTKYHHEDGTLDRVFSNKKDLRNGVFIFFYFQKTK